MSRPHAGLAPDIRARIGATEAEGGDPSIATGGSQLKHLTLVRGYGGSHQPNMLAFTMKTAA